MPTYYFCFEGEPYGHGSDAHDFVNADVARCEAAKTIGAMICDSGHEPLDQREWDVKVTDANGLVLFWISAIICEAPAMLSPSRAGIDLIV